MVASAAYDGEVEEGTDLSYAVVGILAKTLGENVGDHHRTLEGNVAEIHTSTFGDNVAAPAGGTKQLNHKSC